jgi:uncharacterized membrane protein YidH (DUF202 family)
LLLNIMLRRAGSRFALRRRFWSPPTLVENTGSIARDILATERTFLAWARTGLGFVGAGSALFAAYHRQSDNITEEVPINIVQASALLIANGGFLLVFATRRYLTVVSALKQGRFLVDTRGPLTAVLLTSISTVTSLGLALPAEVASNHRNGIKKDPEKTQ